MGMLDLFHRAKDDTVRTSRCEILSQYKRLHKVRRPLNDQLASGLAKDVVQEGGRKLGILRRDTLYFDSEDVVSVLMDYCIYDVRRQGRNAIEQRLIDSPPAADSLEMTCLRAMQQPHYSVFVVESVERGLGVTVRDLLSKDEESESLFVVDIGFGSTAAPDVILATRVLPHGDYWTTSGAPLPIGVVARDDLAAIRDEFAFAIARASDESFDPAPIIRECLEQGCASSIEYAGTPERHIQHSSIRRDPRGQRIRAPGRNDPCPCGSGRKYKKCCLR